MEQMTLIYDLLVQHKGKRLTAEEIAKKTGIEYKVVLVHARTMLTKYPKEFPNMRKKTVRKNTFFTGGAISTTQQYSNVTVSYRVKE